MVCHSSPGGDLRPLYVVYTHTCTPRQKYTVKKNPQETHSLLKLINLMVNNTPNLTISLHIQNTYMHVHIHEYTHINTSSSIKSEGGVSVHPWVEAITKQSNPHRRRVIVSTENGTRKTV